MTTTHLHSTSADEATPAFSVAIAIYTDAAKDLAAAYRGLLTAKEFAEAGDRVTVIYDGSGVDTLAAATDPEHQLHRLVEQLRPLTRGACGFCAKAHGVLEPLGDGDWSLLEEYKGHASLRHLMAEGYQVLAF